MSIHRLYHGDTLKVLRNLPSESVECIITSPPYWGLRDYGVGGQIGLEPTLKEYLDKLLLVTAELKRVLRKDGVMFWNHGNSYSGGGNPNDNKRANGVVIPDIKDVSVRPKCLSMQNYRLALRMIDEQGWTLRNVIVWYKPNAMPSSVKDRFNNVYEPVFMFSKSRRYWFDLDAVREPHSLSSFKRYKGTYNGEYDRNSDTAMSAKVADASRSLPLAGKNPGDVWSINTEPFPESHFAVFPPCFS